MVYRSGSQEADPACLEPSTVFPHVYHWEMVMGRGGGPKPAWILWFLESNQLLPSGQGSDMGFLAQSLYRSNSDDYVFQA